MAEVANGGWHRLDSQLQKREDAERMRSATAFNALAGRLAVGEDVPVDEVFATLKATGMDRTQLAAEVLRRQTLVARREEKATLEEGLKQFVPLSKELQEVDAVRDRALADHASKSLEINNQMRALEGKRRRLETVSSEIAANLTAEEKADLASNRDHERWLRVQANRLKEQVADRENARPIVGSKLLLTTRNEQGLDDAGVFTAEKAAEYDAETATLRTKLAEAEQKAEQARLNSITARIETVGG